MVGDVNSAAVRQPNGLRPRVPKASDVLADRLRGRILGSGLQPGDELPSEAELIETHEFSRGTVREALRLLEAEGLVVIKRGPRGGVRVSRPDVSQVSRSLALLFTSSEVTLREFFVFRKLLEPQAAAIAAQAATPEQRTWLGQLAAEYRGITRGLGRSAEFHGAIGECTNNTVLQLILAATHQVLEWHAPGERLSHDDIDATRRVHRRIAQAIAVGDGSAASRIMLRHLETFEKVLREQGRLDEPVVPRARWAALLH